MFIQGMAGMIRRMYDGGVDLLRHGNERRRDRAAEQRIMHLHTAILVAAVGLGLCQIPFIINFFWSIRNGKKVESDNPWQATTLEWQTPTPPPHGNFATEPIVLPRPLRVQRAGRRQGLHPAEPEARLKPPSIISHGNSLHRTKPRPDTGLYNAKVGIWLFLASEVMLFGALFSSYILLRVGATGWHLAPRLAEHPDRHLQHRRADHLVGDGGAGLGVAEGGNFGKYKFYQAITISVRLGFLGIKSFEYADKFNHYEVWLKNP